MKKLFLLTKLLLTMAILSVGASASWAQASYNHTYTSGTAIGEVTTGSATYFLYNIGAGKFLTDGMDWGTHASVDNAGRLIKFTSATNGYALYTESYSVNNGEEAKAGYMTLNGYLDTGSNDADWVFTSVSVAGYENVYTIKHSDTQYLYYSSSNCYVNVGENTEDSYSYWLIIPIATRQAANDYTYLLQNTDFNRVDTYQGNTNVGKKRIIWNESGGTFNSAGGNDNNRCAEIYNGTFTFSQTVAQTVPNGKYTLHCQGFYRAGFANGNNSTDQNAQLYINTTTSQLTNAATGGSNTQTEGYSTECDSKYIPNWMTEASTAFSAGGYADNAVTAIVTDGSISVGLKSETTIAGDWTIIDNFVLDYLGTTLINDAVEFTNGTSMTANTWYYYDISNAATYTITAESALANIVYTTDGTMLTADANSNITANFTSSQSLSATRYYFKSSSAQELSFSRDLLNQPFTQLYEKDGETEITNVTQYGFTVAEGMNHSVTDGKLQTSITNAGRDEVYSIFPEAATSGVVNVSLSWNMNNVTGNGSYTSFYLADTDGNRILSVYYYGQKMKIYVNGTGDNNALLPLNSHQVARSKTFSVTATIDLDNKIIRSLKLAYDTYNLSKKNFAFENSSAISIGRIGFKNNSVKGQTVTATLDDIIISNNAVNYILNAILEGGAKLKTLYQNYSDFASSEVVYFPKSINVNNKWYTTSETTFSKTFTEPGTQTVTYASDETFDYFFEFEELDLIGAFAAYENVNSRSNGSSARLFGTSSGGGTTARVWTPALAGGTYTLKTMSKGANNNQELTLYICNLDGSNPYYTGKSIASRSTSSWSESTLENLVIPDGKALCFFNNSTSNHNHYIDYFTLTRTGDATVSASIGTTGYATLASNYDLDFTGMTGLKAYKATISDNDITFTAVDQVPAGEGVLLRATNTLSEPTPFVIPVTSGVAAWAADDNAFVRGTGAAVATSDGTTYNYVLSTKNGVVGFYQANGNSVPATKAYLQTTTSDPARLALNFNDDVTAIKSISPALSEDNNAVYSLSGQRVAVPSKGLYIMNGKKVIMK